MSLDNMPDDFMLYAFMVDQFPIITCSCGRSHTRQQWLNLRLVGIQDVGDGGPDLEIRDCVCGSSISIEVPHIER